MRVAVATPAPIDAVTSSQSELSGDAGSSVVFPARACDYCCLAAEVVLPYYGRSSLCMVGIFDFRLFFSLAVCSFNAARLFPNIPKQRQHSSSIAGKGRSAQTFTEWVKRSLSCMTPGARIRDSRRLLSTQKLSLAPAGSPSRKSPLQRDPWCHLIFIPSRFTWRPLPFKIVNYQLTFRSATM